MQNLKAIPVYKKSSKKKKKKEIKLWRVVCSKIILYIALSLQIKPKQVFLCILIDPNYILAPEVFYQMQFYLVELL